MYWCRSLRCCSPSYSTATLTSSQPISKYAMALPNSLITGICVCGLGNPAWISTTRSQDSFGDCAPPSNRSTASRARAIPRRPAYLRVTSSTSAALTLVARASASIAATAVVMGYQQPKSRAVLVGEVTRMAAIVSISSSSIRSRCVWIPGGLRRLSWISSTTWTSFAHLLPCRAAAANPATTPRRPVQSHPAFARNSASTSRSRSA